VTPDGRLIVYGRVGDSGIFTLRDDELIALISGPELLEALRRYPRLGQMTRMQIWDVAAGSLGDRSALVVQAGLRGDGIPLRGVIAFVDADGDDASLIGIFDAGERTPIRAAWGIRPTGEPWLHVAFINDGEIMNQIAWADAADTRLGLVFVEAGSTLAAAEDLTGLVSDGPGAGWACDDKGRIYRYTTAGNGSAELVAPAAGMHVYNMLAIDWDVQREQPGA